MPEWLDVALTLASLGVSGAALFRAHSLVARITSARARNDRLYKKHGNRLNEHIQSNLHR